MFGQKNKTMKKTWISIRIIEGEYENSDAACDAMLDGWGDNFDESHPLCDVILGLTEEQIEYLNQIDQQQRNEEQP